MLEFFLLAARRLARSVIPDESSVCVTPRTTIHPPVGFRSSRKPV